MPLPVSTILNTNAISALSAKSVKTSLCAPLVGKAATSQTRFGRCKNLLNILALCAAAFLAPTQVAFAVVDPTGPASAWGALAPFPGLGQCKQTAAGYLHTLALREDGIIVAWGRNYERQCEVPATNTYIFVAAGYFHSLAIIKGPSPSAGQAAGQVVAWGWNYYGQCNVPADLGPCTAVSGGNGHSVALRIDGTVWGWGDNSYGQCGSISITPPDNTTNDSKKNYYTQDLGTGVIIKEIAAGGYHTLARSDPTFFTTEGNVFAWGMNSYGQCGSYTDQNPNGYYQLNIQCTKIAAGGFHSVAIQYADSHVISWGANFSGQCGVSSSDINEQLLKADEPEDLTLNVKKPYWTKVIGSVGSNDAPRQFLIATDIAAGYWHTVAVQNGTKEVYGWGDNDYGQCGDILFCIRKKPGLRENGGLDPIIDCTLDKDPNSDPDPLKQKDYPIEDQWRCSCWDPGTGTVYYPNRNSTLGSYWKKALGSIGSTELLVLATNGISAGGYHTVAIKFDTATDKGLVAAWGANNYGQCDVPPSDDAAHAEALWKQVSGGYWHTLGIDKDQKIIAWGENNSKQCEAPGSTKVEFGPFVYWATPLSGTAYQQVSAGKWHSLALTASGTVVAWGAGTTNDPNPAVYRPDNFEFGQSIVPPSLPICTAIAAGAFHSLALTSTGTVVAWGSGAFGDTGFGDSDGINWGQSFVPITLTPCKAIAAGGFHSLAIQDDYTVVAWGAGIYDFTFTDGTLDYNTYLLWGQSKVPTDGVDLNNVPIPLKAKAIAAGYAHSVALKFDGTVVAWGAGTRYKAEGGYSHMEYGQAIAPLGTYTKIAAGYAHNLAIDALSNFVVAWGWNDYGQCGFADEEVIHNYLWVKPCLGLVSKISAGSIHSLAIRNFSAITSVTPSSGSIAGGTIITISGTNLASNLCLPTVMIGTTPATNVSVSSGVITATTPTAPNGSAGPQNVVVSNPYYSVVAINGFEYTATLTSLTSVSPLIGPTTGGTTFTIRGSHLENISGVSIGGARATIVSQTPTKIMAKTPAGNVGSSNIVVTSSTGSLTNPSVFIYTSGGGSVPTIASLEPSSGATSGGTVITIRGTGFLSTSGVSFGGIDTTFNVLSDTVITAISPSGTDGIENVVVTTLLGESCTAEEAFTYTSCASDLDGSGVVDSGDVGMVLLDTGECQGCPTDLDGSGFVDSGDVGMVLLDSGPCQ